MPPGLRPTEPVTFVQETTEDSAVQQAYEHAIEHGLLVDLTQEPGAVASAASSKSGKRKACANDTRLSKKCKKEAVVAPIQQDPPAVTAMLHANFLGWPRDVCQGTCVVGVKQHWFDNQDSLLLEHETPTGNEHYTRKTAKLGVNSIRFVHLPIETHLSKGVCVTDNGYVIYANHSAPLFHAQVYPESLVTLDKFRQDVAAYNRDLTQKTGAAASAASSKSGKNKKQPASKKPSAHENRAALTTLLNTVATRWPRVVCRNIEIVQSKGRLLWVKIGGGRRDHYWVEPIFGLTQEGSTTVHAKKLAVVYLAIKTHRAEGVWITNNGFAIYGNRNDIPMPSAKNLVTLRQFRQDVAWQAGLTSATV